MDRNAKTRLNKKMNKTIGESFIKLEEKLITAVSTQVQITVNGKIDNIAKVLDTHGALLQSHSEKINEIKPMLQDYNDKQAAKRVGNKWKDSIYAVLAFMPYVYIIAQFIVKNFTF